MSGSAATRARRSTTSCQACAAWASQVVDARDAAALIAEEQAQPRRQGLFGLLSVGFIAAGVLTLLGFLISALIAARRRAIELGVLRALGMSGFQVAVS